MRRLLLVAVALAFIAAARAEVQLEIMVAPSGGQYFALKLSGLDARSGNLPVEPVNEFQVAAILARALAEKRWCLNGWAITNRLEPEGWVVVEGRCTRPAD